VAGTLELNGRALELSLLALAAAIGALAGGYPKLAVVAAVGIAFVALVLMDVTLGLCLFAIVIFMELLPEFGAAFSFSKLAGLLLAGSWLAAVATRQRRSAGLAGTHPVLAYALILFIVWGLLSLTWAEDSSVVLTPVTRYALNAFLMVIVFAAVSERKHVVWVLGAYVAGAALSAMYGFVTTPPSAADDRVTGTIGDPNELAAVLVPAFILGMALAASVRRLPLLRFFALGAALVAILGLFLTLSRGGLVALGVALLAAILVGGRWRPAAVLVTLLIAFAGVSYFTVLASPQAKAHVSELGSGTGREDIWKVGLREFRANQLTGVGAGNFQTSSRHYLLEPGEIQRSDLIVDTPKVAHNTYLQVLAELGVPGLALFVAIIAFCLICLYAAARRFAADNDLRMELIARALLVSLIGLLAADFFISEMYNKQLWLLLGLGPAVLAVAKKRSGAAPVARWSEAPDPAV
jgi:O-antigen ligase